MKIISYILLSFVCSTEVVHNAVVCPLSNRCLRSIFQQNHSSFVYSRITSSHSSFPPTSLLVSPRQTVPLIIS